MSDDAEDREGMSATGNTGDALQVQVLMTTGPWTLVPADSAERSLLWLGRSLPVTSMRTRGKHAGPTWWRLLIGLRTQAKSSSRRQECATAIAATMKAGTE